MTPVALITAEPRNAGTGAATTVRMAGGGNLKGYRYGGQSYRAGLAALPRLKASFDVDETGFTGKTVPTTGAITWAPAGKAALSELAAFFWRDAPISVSEGMEEDGVFTARLTGKVADAQVQGQKLVLTVADFGADLAKRIVTARFLGTGGVEGSAETKGRIKRRSWGQAFNIEGRILDKANNVFEFGDPAFPWQSIDLVRDIGREEAPAHAVVAWQGSISSTLEALRTSTPAVGTGVVAPSICCAKWWTRPVLLTADVHGEVGAGYVETGPAIAQAILAAVSGPAITNVAPAAVLRPDACGISVDENDTIASTLDRLLLPISLLWPLDPAGTVTLREMTFAAPVATLRSERVERLRTLPPVKTRRVGYKRASRVHSEGELATILLEAGASFVQESPPAALDSAPGAHWQDSDDNFRLYVRVAGSGFLQLVGGAVILDGAAVELAWTEAGAGPDNTADNQVVIVRPVDQAFAADWLGVIPTTSYPRVLTPAVTRGGVDIRTDAGTSYSISNTNVTATVDNVAASSSKGQITITAAATGWIDLTVTVGGVAQPVQRIPVRVDRAEPPSGGSGSGGGTGNKSGSFGPLDLIENVDPTYVRIGDRITITKGTGETIRAYASALGYQYFGVGGGQAAKVKWRYATAGTNMASPTDMGAAVTGGVSTRDPGIGGDLYPSSVTCNQTAAPTNGDYDVELWAALPASGGSIIFDGTTCSVQVGV
jgi:hypothetical protein